MSDIYEEFSASKYGSSSHRAKVLIEEIQSLRQQLADTQRKLETVTNAASFLVTMALSTIDPDDDNEPNCELSQGSIRKLKSVIEQSKGEDNA